MGESQSAEVMCGPSAAVPAMAITERAQQPIVKVVLALAVGLTVADVLTLTDVLKVAVSLAVIVVLAVTAVENSAS